ncbi:MAG: class I SAM-dependent methyltransferase [Chloroflexi bacterium]|nr:class I SAM-dependent methyltransferase [Chloroflexota bacterium]
MVDTFQPRLLPPDFEEDESLAADRPAVDGERPPRGQREGGGQGKYAGKHPRNKLNELTGDEWIFFTKSVITTAYASDYGHRLRKAHGANKPPQLMKSLIEFFTDARGRVLDPFAGVGGTLIGAAIAAPPRDCVGIEINARWVAIYRKVVAQSAGALVEYPLHQGDSQVLLADRALFPDESFDFVCTDPPYNVHLTQTMANDPRYVNGHTNRRTDYNMRSEDTADLANLESYEAYLDAMQRMLGHCYRLLKPQKYLAIILRDAYQQGRYVFTHVDVARRAESVGFVTKGVKVWYQAGTRLRPYGYPFAYIPNIAHQHIVILQKPRPVGSRQ